MARFVASGQVDGICDRNRASLGLDKLEDTQELPVLPIIDYSEEQIEEIRRKQREAYQSKDECAAEGEIEA
jgi:hypothetical protein